MIRLTASQADQGAGPTHDCGNDDDADHVHGKTDQDGKRRLQVVQIQPLAHSDKTGDQPSRISRCAPGRKGGA